LALGLAFARSFLPLALILAPMGALTALAYNESLFHGASGSPRRAARMAINEAARTAGFVAGASGGGLLLQRTSFRATLLVTAAAILAAAVVQILLTALVGPLARVVPCSNGENRKKQDGRSG
jgi:DHA1 family multidrug resistance protein-like MFS transporter/DHA1 family quinolone resistance protein-like MFS transporter